MRMTREDQRVTSVTVAEPELIAMIERIAGRRKSISHSTAIYQDLRIAGDDAFELLEMISARFGTSFQGFDWRAYFPDELEAGLFHWGAILGIRDTKRRTLTVGHLLAVIERGAWFEATSSD
jgi:hypothetical protein